MLIAISGKTVKKSAVAALRRCLYELLPTDKVRMEDTRYSIEKPDKGPWHFCVLVGTPEGPNAEKLTAIAAGLGIKECKITDIP